MERKGGETGGGAEIDGKNRSKRKVKPKTKRSEGDRSKLTIHKLYLPG